MERNAPARFIACNNQHCSKKFKFIDFATVHTVVDGPDPRDHFANERNLLTWVRVGMVMCLIGFMTLLDLRTQVFAPAQSLPWAGDAQQPLRIQVVAYIFISLGLISICVAIGVYFKNMHQILHRKLVVGHGWAGYTMTGFVVLFVLFVMAAAIS